MELLTLVGLVILLCFAFPALSSFILTYISSNAGYTGLSVIVGTLPGFVSGAYLPIETLSESVVNALNVLPFSPAAMLLRKPLGGYALDDMADGKEVVRNGLGEFYGFDFYVGDWHFESPPAIVGLLAVGVAFTILGAMRIRGSIK